MIRGSASWIVLDGPRAVAIRVSSKPRCAECGGSALATLQTSRAGFAAGTDFEHDADCPSLRCHHGVTFVDECKRCETEEEERNHEA